MLSHPDLLSKVLSCQGLLEEEGLEGDSINILERMSALRTQ